MCSWVFIYAISDHRPFQKLLVSAVEPPTRLSPVRILIVSVKTSFEEGPETARSTPNVAISDAPEKSRRHVDCIVHI